MVVGETIVLENVSVTAEEYRTKLIVVFQSMCEKMWWFHADARYTISEAESVRVPCGKLQGGKWKFSKTAWTRCEEAGTEFFYQHNGARPTLQSKMPDPSQHIAR